MGQFATDNACLVLGIPMPNESVEYDIDMVRLKYKSRLLQVEEEKCREKEKLLMQCNAGEKNGLSDRECYEVFGEASVVTPIARLRHHTRSR